MPLWVGAAVLVTTVAGCGSAPGEVGAKRTSTREPSVTSTPSPAPPPPCQAWECRTRQTVNLTPGWTVRLWRGGDQQNYASRPVVELLYLTAFNAWATGAPSTSASTEAATRTPRRKVPSPPMLVPMTSR